MNRENVFFVLIIAAGIIISLATIYKKAVWDYYKRAVN